MALAKLTILIEKSGAKLNFDQSESVEALFNPERLTFSKSASWKTQNAAQRDTPELQFTNSEPRSLSVDLLFDTYDSPGVTKEDVRRKYTDRLLGLTVVETHGDKHRPPVCRLSWGRVGVFFQGVLERLEQQFTMFMDDGTPVRANVKCTFKEWRTNYDDLNRQHTQSADVAKTRITKRGESLAMIAAAEYGDPRKWRPIAIVNEIENPLDLKPGTVLLIPVLTETQAL
jgi:nucleoid-associated protein YgaU